MKIRIPIQEEKTTNNKQSPSPRTRNSIQYLPLTGNIGIGPRQNQKHLELKKLKKTQKNAKTKKNTKKIERRNQTPSFYLGLFLILF